MTFEDLGLTKDEVKVRLREKIDSKNTRDCKKRKIVSDWIIDNLEDILNENNQITKSQDDLATLISRPNKDNITVKQGTVGNTIKDLEGFISKQKGRNKIYNVYFDRI